MKNHRNRCRSHPSRPRIDDLLIGQWTCAGCLRKEDPEPDSIIGRAQAAEETGTPGLIAAIQEEYEARGETLSPGMYRWLLGQDTKDIAIELDRLRAVGESP